MEQRGKEGGDWEGAKHFDRADSIFDVKRANSREKGRNWHSSPFSFFFFFCWLYIRIRLPGSLLLINDPSHPSYPQEICQ